MSHTITMITVCVLLILQYSRNRVFTSTTIWIFLYACFFGIAPMISGHNITADRYACIGILSFFCGYLFNLAMERRKHSVQYNYTETTAVEREGGEYYAEGKNRIIADNAKILFVLTVISMIAYLGTSGIRQVIFGELTTTGLLRSGLGKAGNLFSYFKSWLGYALVILYVFKNGKVSIRYYIIVAAYAVFFAVFTFTRSGLFIFIGMLIIYAMRKVDPKRQVIVSLAAIAAGIVAMSAMMYLRVWGIVAVRANISISNILSGVENNLDFFSGYKHFSHYAENPVRITPLVYFKVLFAIIPRSLWPGKPFRSSIEIMKQIDFATYSRGISTGYTNLGVMLAAFDIFGVLLGPAVWAIVTGALDNRYLRSIKIGADQNIWTCLYLYFSTAVVMQGFREGTDVAILNLPIIIIVFLFITHFDLRHGKIILK